MEKKGTAQITHNSINALAKLIVIRDQNRLLEIERLTDHNENSTMLKNTSLNNRSYLLPNAHIFEYGPKF
ncbi:hypothetical protein [uncultured Weissella sp.]|uniref:hypothetical protein n=1 Tax=uncultured Weissella sp. TaxID=253243 RepID=UPI002583114A|nr:hypothetical protein [uncultured Weissella sp.]